VRGGAVSGARLRRAPEARDERILTSAS
jgi:hypothetical protein